MTTTSPNDPRREPTPAADEIDRVAFPVNAEAYAALLARFDAPAQPNERLRATMGTPPPWTLG